MSKKEYLAKIFVVFGITTLITWIVNFIILIIPFQFKIAKWVYLFSQEVSERSIFPLLGLLAVVGGTYLCNSAKESKCRCAVWAERVSAVLSIFFFAGLVTIAVVYSLSVRPLLADVKTQILGEADKVKSQIVMMAQSNPSIKQENIQNGLQDLEKRVGMELAGAKNDIITNSVKIIFDLLAFALAYLILAVLLIKMSLLKETKVKTESCLF
ncbi:MAG: hypothetical protein WCG23_02315 [bacterium]